MRVAGLPTPSKTLDALNAAEYERVSDITFPTAFIKSIVPNPDGGLYIITNDIGLLYLNNETWVTYDNLPAHATSIAVDPANTDTLYVGTVQMGVFRSTDAGQTWQNISDGLGLMPGFIVRVTALAVDTNQPNHLVSATAYDIGDQTTSGSIYESFDGGLSWQKIADSEVIVEHLTILDGNIYLTSGNELTLVNRSDRSMSIDHQEYLMKLIEQANLASRF